MTLSPAALVWLEGRSLDIELCDKMGLFSENAGGEEIIGYPILRSGGQVGCKYRPLKAREGGQRFWRKPGDITACCYNEDALRRDDLLDQPLIVVEGYEDCLSVLQSGFERCVSVPDGAPQKPIDGPESSAKYAWIEAVSDLITYDRVKEVILFVDADSAGAALMHDLSHRFGRSRCKFVQTPFAKDTDTRLKDANSVLEAYGPAGVRKTVERAQWIKADGVYTWSELPIQPEMPVYDFGMEALHAHLRIRMGDLSVWTGVPSSGKSTLLNHLVCLLAQRHQLRTGFASFEQERRDHQRALRSWFCEDWEFKLTWEQKRDADRWINDAFRLLIPSDDKDPTLEWLLEKMEVAAIQHGCKVLVIDPWNSATHVMDRGETETDYVNRSLRTLSKFAKLFGVHIAVVAHPVKMRRNDDGTWPVPSLYDCAGSAAWFNKPDQGVIVHRNADDVYVKVSKSRYHDILGEPGIVRMNYVRQSRRYVEVERNVIDIEPRRRSRKDVA